MEPNYARDDISARRLRGRAASGAERPWLSVYPDRQHRRPRRPLSRFVRNVYPPPEAEPRGWVDRAGAFLARHDIIWCAAVAFTVALCVFFLLGMPWFLALIERTAR